MKLNHQNCNQFFDICRCSNSYCMDPSQIIALATRSGESTLAVIYHWQDNANLCFTSLAMQRMFIFHSQSYYIKF